VTIRAIISDLHGNREALAAVAADIRKQNADEIVCLGDLVGYGPQPEYCVQWVRRNCHWSLSGNHDAALFMAYPIGFNPAAARAMEWQRNRMIPGTLALPHKIGRWRWLENLSSCREEGDVRYVHASPRDPLMEYVLEDDFQDIGFGPSQKALDIFAAFKRVCFVGHSHRPGIATHDFRWLKPSELDGMRYRLPANQKTLVNIGSVGQPRDRCKDSCYVLFDGDTVTYRRVAYDVAAVQAKITAIPLLDRRLADRLGTGT
jgi:predicted phosphodiesterase